MLSCSQDTQVAFLLEEALGKARITVILERQERAGLMKLADAELRSPSEQLRHLLRQELERCGLWPATQAEKTRDDEA